MTIYNPDGGIILDAPVTTEAVEKFVLMGDWYVLLSFMSLSALDIPEGSYITYKGKKWEIMSPVYPESSGTGYKYSLQFDDQQNKLKKSICFWLGGPNPEAVFSDTTDLTSFGNLIVANMNRELGSEVWEFGGLENVDNQETVKVVSFSGDTCWDAVNNIANTFDCEWWTEQNDGKVSLFFGKLERGSGEIFKEGDVVSQMPARKSNNDDGYGTRFYVFGSTRNLTRDYGQADQGGATNHVSEIRLRLPNNLQYIDARPDLTPSEVTPVVVFFDYVYPKNTDTVTIVEEKTITPEEGDPYPAYVVYAGATPFMPSDVIEDDSFQIQFTSGDLTGLTFDVSINYDPKTWKLEDGFDKKFEIVAQIETSGDSVSIIPNANMKPKPGDTFVLTGVKLPEQRIAEAEQELLEVGTEYAEKHSGDTNVLDCPTNPVYCAENDKNYEAGQGVILQDARFGPDGRRSRIQGYEKKLYNEYVATYTVGDNRTYSRTGKIENDVKQNIYSQRIGTTASGASVYLITRYDQTPATDYNAYSALRAMWQFANKQTDETFKGNVTVSKSLKIGPFISSLFAGKGAGIDQAGNAEFESVRVRSALEVLELLVNRLSAIEGDQVLTEADTIERVDDLGDGCYGLHLRSKWEGYFTAQVENNVLEGIINTLATGSGEYRTSWMRVNSVNAAANYIEVVLYPDEETPAGKNYPPTELMRIARRGNQTDPTRQRCLYLSSTEGRIVRLTGVTKPILDASNYGATLGTLPEFLTAMGLPVIEGQDYVYARGLIVQDIIRIDYQGHPIAEVVDRGPWAAGESYYASALNPSTGRYETSDVWYSGCRYRCAKTGTTAAPAWNSTAWAMVEGNPEFTVSFADTDNIFDPDRFAVTLTVVARLYNLDVTSDILDTDVVWTRYSEDADGVERVASDQAWALRRGGAGKSLDLTAADCDFNGYIPRTLRFTATVTLRDGMGEAAASAAAVFEY